MSSGWFDCTEPSLCTLLQGKQGVQGAYAIVPCTPCFSSKYVDRGGSVESNQLEPMLKNSTHFAISAMMWFEKVRGGSMHLNYTELVQNHPAHLASPLNM